MYLKKISPENTALGLKTAKFEGFFCVFLFGQLFCRLRGELHLHKSRRDNGCTDRGLNDLGHHIPAVVDEREDPLRVAVYDVRRIVRVPLEIKRVPDHNTGEDMTHKSEQCHKKRSEKSGNDNVRASVLCELNLAEDASEAEQGERQDVVEKDAEDLTREVGYPRYVREAENKLDERVYKACAKSHAHSVTLGKHNDRSH